MSCNICGSDKYLTRKYNRKTRKIGIDYFLRKVLPHIDFLVPNKLKKLKKISTNKDFIFHGYVKVCKNCGYGLLVNPPSNDALKKYYSTQYWKRRSTEQENVSTNDGLYKTDTRAINQIEFSLKYIKPKKVRRSLEIGAGSAFSSLLLRDKLQQKVTLDVCEPGIVWNKYYKENIIHKISDYFPFSTKLKYDYIHTSHWLEHVIDLNENVSKLRDVCENGGYLFIEVPNIPSIYWKLPIQDSPHIHFFTKRSLKKLFEDNGFRCLNIVECGPSHKEFLKGHINPNSQDKRNKQGIYLRAIFQKM